MQNGFDYKPGKVTRAVKKIQQFDTPVKKSQNPIGLEQLLEIDSGQSVAPKQEEVEKFQSALADLKNLDIFEIKEKCKDSMPEFCDRLCSAIADPLENQREVRRIMGAIGIDAITYHNAFKRAFLTHDTGLLAGLCNETHLDQLHVAWAAYSDLCTEAFGLINEALIKNKLDLIAPITPTVFEDIFDSARIAKSAEAFAKNNPKFKEWYEPRRAHVQALQDKIAQSNKQGSQENASDFNAWQIEDRTPAAHTAQTQILPRIQQFIERNKIACVAVGIALGGLLTIRSQPSLQYPASWPFAPTIQPWISWLQKR